MKMITAEEIKKLADLARIKVSPEEIEKLTKEADSILGYVAQIKDFNGESGLSVPILRNVMREDVVTNNEGEYTEKLLSNTPSREKQYLKVKKILG